MESDTDADNRREITGIGESEVDIDDRRETTGIGESLFPEIFRIVFVK